MLNLIIILICNGCTKWKVENIIYLKWNYGFNNYLILQSDNLILVL
jgi:hypothetical protein